MITNSGEQSARADTDPTYAAALSVVFPSLAPVDHTRHITYEVFGLTIAELNEQIKYPYPGDWIGYELAVRGLAALKRYNPEMFRQFSPESP